MPNPWRIPLKTSFIQFRPILLQNGPEKDKSIPNGAPTLFASLYGSPGSIVFYVLKKLKIELRELRKRKF